MLACQSFKSASIGCELCIFAQITEADMVAVFRSLTDKWSVCRNLYRRTHNKGRRNLWVPWPLPMLAITCFQVGQTSYNKLSSIWDTGLGTSASKYQRRGPIMETAMLKARPMDDGSQLKAIINTASVVRNLRAFIDNVVTKWACTNVTAFVRSCFVALHQIRNVHHSLTEESLFDSGVRHWSYVNSLEFTITCSVGLFVRCNYSVSHNKGTSSQNFANPWPIFKIISLFN